MNENPQGQQEAADRAARIIAQALMEAEVILAAERESRIQTVPPQLVEALDRFGDVLAKLVEMTERMSDRVSELSASIDAMAQAKQAEDAAAAEAAAHAAAQESSYVPGGEGIDVTIASVPGFQGLMEVQRTLVRMPQVQSASVRRYQDDLAAIQLILSQPMTPTAIAEGVSSGTGRQLVVDEAATEQLRLRLRFLDTAQ